MNFSGGWERPFWLREQWHERLSLHFKEPVCIILEEELRGVELKGI